MVANISGTKIDDGPGCTRLQFLSVLKEFAVIYLEHHDTDFPGCTWLQFLAVLRESTLKRIVERIFP